MPGDAEIQKGSYNNPFELTMTIGERKKGKVKCPKCKGDEVVPQLGGFMAQTSKKS